MFALLLVFAISTTIHAFKPVANIHTSLVYRNTLPSLHTTTVPPHLQVRSLNTCLSLAKQAPKTERDDEVKDPSAFDKVASMGLAGILAIAAAEAIFWALGVPLAALYYKVQYTYDSMKRQHVLIADAYRQRLVNGLI
jgi:hypothetical protein